MTDSEAAAVIAANEVFYTSIEKRDLAALTALLADGPYADSAVMVHPARFPVVGREKIEKWWRAFAESGQFTQIFLTDVEARVSRDVASVSCSEGVLVGLQNGTPSASRKLTYRRCVTTNIFVRDTSGAWRLWIHHASQVHERQPTAGLRAGEQ